jgi:hypothetical protein
MSVCSYGPHIAAIVMLVLMVALKAPIIYDLMVLYQHQSPPILFTCIVVDVVFLFWYCRRFIPLDSVALFLHRWIILWLALTLKRDWPFKVGHSVAELITMLKAQKMIDGEMSGSIRSTSVWRTQSRDKQAALAHALMLVFNDEVDGCTTYKFLVDNNRPTTRLI